LHVLAGYGHRFNRTAKELLALVSIQVRYHIRNLTRDQVHIIKGNLVFGRRERGQLLL
jgi:hypothetical protein